ncbi:MAG: hypothetical protein KKC05_02000 [Nanoarchaeota archaeon]|nr:hypothetical protein [Nanoarchaeota archaeon]
MRGQIWSVDFVVSAIIFFTVLFLVILVWNYTSVQGSEVLALKNMQSAAMKTSDALIRTGGLPDDWNGTNVYVIGLADGDNILNQTKVLRFINTPYSKAKSLLTGEYDFYFEMLHLNGTVINESGTNLTTGAVIIDPVVVVPVERYVLYRDEITRLRLIVWK